VITVSTPASAVIAALEQTGEGLAVEPLESLSSRTKSTCPVLGFGAPVLRAEEEVRLNENDLLGIIVLGGRATSTLRHASSLRCPGIRRGGDDNDDGAFELAAISGISFSS